jgi:hypothetical protein
MYTTIYTIYPKVGVLVPLVLSNYLETNMSQQVYDETQVRRVQTPDEYSFTFCFPKTFARALGIHKGDFLKCQIQDNKLMVEKAHPIGNLAPRIYLTYD